MGPTTNQKNPNSTPLSAKSITKQKMKAGEIDYEFKSLPILKLFVDSWWQFDNPMGQAVSEVVTSAKRIYKTNYVGNFNF